MNSRLGKGIRFAALLLAATASADPERKAEVVSFCVGVYADQVVDRALDEEDVRQRVKDDPASLERLERHTEQWVREREFQLIRTWEKAVDRGIELGFDPEWLYRAVKMVCLENSLEYVDEK